MFAISLIHASRSRAAIAAETAKRWLSSAKNKANIEYILSIDTDDDTMEYARLFQEINITKALINPNKNAVEAINIAAKKSTGRIIMVISDDFNSCPNYWDEYLINELKDKQDFVVKTQDGYQPWIITLPIMDRVYYNRFGYVYYPKYEHLFCDTELTHVADLLGKTIKLPIRFTHNHYMQTGMKPDEVSLKAQRTWAQGERLYLDRMMRNFDLPESDIVGVLNCCHGHLAFLKSKGIQIELV